MASSRERAGGGGRVGAENSWSAPGSRTVDDAGVGVAPAVCGWGLAVVAVLGAERTLPPAPSLREGDWAGDPPGCGDGLLRVVNASTRRMPGERYQPARWSG